MAKLLQHHGEIESVMVMAKIPFVFKKPFQFRRSPLVFLAAFLAS
jgi:hypothetical protein